MKIEIHLTIDEKMVAKACEENNCTRERFVETVRSLMEYNMGQTIEDNEEFWASQTFEIDP
jgi:hypothetical protein